MQIVPVALWNCKEQENRILNQFWGGECDECLRVLAVRCICAWRWEGLLPVRAAACAASGAAQPRMTLLLGPLLCRSHFHYDNGHEQFMDGRKKREGTTHLFPLPRAIMRLCCINANAHINNAHSTEKPSPCARLHNAWMKKFFLSLAAFAKRIFQEHLTSDSGCLSTWHVHARLWGREIQ